MNNMSKWAIFLAAGLAGLAQIGNAQTPELRAGVSVQLAPTRNAVAMPDADLRDSSVVAVTRTGSIYLEVTRMTAAELTARLKSDFAGRAGMMLYVKCDAQAPYSNAAGALQAARSAGLSRVALLTDQSDPSDTRRPIPVRGIEVALRSAAPAGAMALRAASSPQGVEVAVDNQIVPIASLEAALRQRLQGRRDAEIAIQADGKVAYGDVVRIIDSCRGAGARVSVGPPGA